MSEDGRFIRQTSLSQFGAEGQRKLAHGRVLVVGLGGLGLPVASYLNAMGVGTLGLVEQDLVELHNLQRQVLYTEKDIGKPKIEVALERLKAQNNQTDFIVFDRFLTKDNAIEIISDFDIVVDATDNFPTRYLINDACVILEKPFVYGALHGFEGHVSVFNHAHGPTYRCLFPTQPDSESIPNCDAHGVLGVLPGIIGTLQALETVKLLTGIGEVLSGRLLLYDGLTQATNSISFKADPKNKNETKLKPSYNFVSCPSKDTITIDELMSLLKTKPQIIDVRTEAEYQSHGLKEALNIPLQQLHDELKAIDFAKPVYLICQSGQRAKMAYQELKKTQPKAVLYTVLGGMANIPLHASTN